MNKVIINVSNAYTAYVGSDILCEIGRELPSKYESSKIAIITDEVVAKLHLNCLVTSLENAGFNLCIHIFKASEKTKNMQTVSNILNFFAQNRITCTDLVISFGGGVICDIVGFCASIYLRGINFISIPTTLLAMINSSIGGKTAINNEFGANQIGTFYHPKAVLCDIKTLKTLPRNTFRDGVAEVIKYGAIYDNNLLESLCNIVTDDDILSIITRCIRIKSSFLSTDEFDKGIGIFLEFGNTIAHAIEHYSNYSIKHGQAVSIGMAMTTKMSENNNLSKKGTYSSLSSVIKHFNLPLSYNIPHEDLLNQIRRDSKINGDILNLVLLKEMTKPFIHKVKLSSLINSHKDYH